MQIYNEKTGVSFVAGTAKMPAYRGAGFEARVIQSKINLATGLLDRQSLVFTARAATRSKARIIAYRACKSLADNHAWVN